MITDEDKKRIARKMVWEGGLEEYMDYGVDDLLYNEFKEEFDSFFEKYVNKEKKLPKKKFMDFEIKVVSFLGI